MLLYFDKYILLLLYKKFGDHELLEGFTDYINYRGY